MVLMGSFLTLLVAVGNASDAAEHERQKYDAAMVDAFFAAVEKHKAGENRDMDIAVYGASGYSFVGYLIVRYGRLGTCSARCRVSTAHSFASLCLLQLPCRVLRSELGRRVERVRVGVATRSVLAAPLGGARCRAVR